MSTAYVVTALVTVAANAFSGFAAMTRLGPVMRVLSPALARAGVPESWLVWPIGALKALGALGLAVGLAGVPLVGTAAAAGLVLYFVCALYTHLRVSDFSPQFYLAIAFLGLAVATLALDPALLLDP
ncbi:DoxX family protein [Nonomuraea phyllanthi]|uniref:DoxX family protein n=1 Tax=Nonomuraea phyllanthi TaxID=2219224 RepID=A0A5C4WK61_9ACTN|nr:DoxX family protein [Nonomuraea phyllanthi]KAB8194661.1 DoxX family protein [Nonomuraea phyllanthi]QFY09082.1 DoxX family protein [Nonomuraea phyllanthi]